MTRRRLTRQRHRLAEVTDLVPGQRLPHWRPSRLNLRYQPALRLAELILRSSSFDLGRGAVPDNGFLVSMPVVFEDFVTVALGRELQRQFDGRVVAQDSQWRLDQDHEINLRPDLVWYPSPRHDRVVRPGSWSTRSTKPRSTTDSPTPMCTRCSPTARLYVCRSAIWCTRRATNPCGSTSFRTQVWTGPGSRSGLTRWIWNRRPRRCWSRSRSWLNGLGGRIRPGAPAADCGGLDCWNRRSDGLENRWKMTFAMPLSIRPCGQPIEATPDSDRLAERGYTWGITHHGHATSEWPFAARTPVGSAASISRLGRTPSTSPPVGRCDAYGVADRTGPRGTTAGRQGPPLDVVSASQGQG